MNIPLKHYLALLRRYLQPQRGKVLWLAVLLFSSIGLQLLNPQVIRYFIDTAVSGGSQPALIKAAFLFMAIVLVQRAVMIGTTYIGEDVAWTATNGLRTDLTRHILHLDMAFHHAHTPGELLERIDGDVDRLANFFSSLVLELLSGGLLTIGVLGLLFLEDWRLGVILALFALLYLAVHAWDQQWAAAYWRHERQYAADLFGFIGERVLGLKDIQTNGAVVYTMGRFYHLLRRLSMQALKADVITDAGWTTSKIIFDAGVAAGMGLGAYLFWTDVITLGTVYLIIYYLTMLNEPLNRIANQLEDLQRVKVSVERVDALLATRPTIVDGAGASLPNGPLAVMFRNVSFGYNSDTLAVHNLSFELPPGQVLGLLGKTGSGKTSLSRLLFRLYDASAGSITLGGVDLHRLPLANLRQHIGLVTQEVQLFQASVRDNLTLFDPTISDTRIMAALHSLGLEPWYGTLPAGLDTPITANGGDLSAGEAQLLALARVFLKDPGLIILDEASSRLDPATEQLLEQAINKLLQNRTCIIIAHRLNTIRRANQVLILEQGAVQEAGSYHTLANRPDSHLSRLLQANLQYPTPGQEVSV